MGVMKRMICLMFILTGGLKAGTHLQAQASADSTSRDQLRQLSAQLRQSPSDQALREKIIALALTMNPRPATPDDAIMAEGAAEYAFKNAKANSDFADAAKQYEKALVLAPWLAVDYFNCGVAHEKAGENKEAIQSFSLYLLAAPNSDDAVAVKKRMGGLQYAAQKADNAARDQARVANWTQFIEDSTARCGDMRKATPGTALRGARVIVGAPGHDGTRQLTSSGFMAMKSLVGRCMTIQLLRFIK